MAAADERVVGITPAMREGSGMVEYSRRFPERYFDVGICEQHAVTLGAGLACEGLRPVVAIYSSFLQRGYDQLIHDVALQNLPVVFALDRGGLVGNDGPTHHGAYDLSFLRCIPNMTVMAPADENECRQMLYTGITLDGPSAVRYPRGTGPGAPIQIEMKALPLGKAEVRRRGKGVALLAFGAMVPVAEQVAEKLDATVVNMRFVKPLDEDLVLAMARSHSALVTLEDNAVMGGAGSAVGECLAAHRVLVPLLNLGIPDHYIEHGSRGECLAAAGLDADSVLEALRAWRREPELRTVGES
jgi:1-deoxy-D-xylulose-5-phosphate synthase